MYTFLVWQLIQNSTFIARPKSRHQLSMTALAQPEDPGILASNRETSMEIGICPTITSGNFGWNFDRSNIDTGAV